MSLVNQYVEARNGGYYVVGSRIPLDVVIAEFRLGRTAETIFDAFPSLGSLARVYGAIATILEHPTEVERYLREQERAFAGIQAEYPMPAETTERLNRTRSELLTRKV